VREIVQVRLLQLPALEKEVSSYSFSPKLPTTNEGMGIWWYPKPCKFSEG
jgi:hypothetical protein